MGLDLDGLRYKLDNILNQETADSLNEWLNNKRDMNDETRAQFQVIYALNNIQSIIHDLTLDELDALIDEVKCVYERYSDITDTRKHDKQE